MKKVFCPNCNKNVSYTIEDRLIEKYKSKEVNVIEKVPICNECKEELFIPEIEQENFDVLYSKYREVANIISPDKIIKFREKYGISQRELVSILGWGKMTINRYERGALPTQSHSDYLKLIIEDNSIFEEIVEKAYAEERINKKTYDRIKKSFTNKINELQIKIINSKLKHRKDIYNGFAKFDIYKIENIISYIADKVDNLYKTSLNKYLFYIDFLCYNENSLSVTGLRYAKYKFGPIIEEKGYEDILNLSSDKFYKEEQESNSFDSYIIKIKSNKNYDLSMLKNYEIDAIDMVIEKLKDMSCRQISELSHTEDAWIKTETNELISFDYSEKLSI